MIKTGNLLNNKMEELLDNLSSKLFYWGRVRHAVKSWIFRMYTLTDEDLKNKVPRNNLGIYSIYCDKSDWRRGDGIENFWYVINEGWIWMQWDYWESLND